MTIYRALLSDKITCELKRHVKTIITCTSSCKCNHKRIINDGVSLIHLNKIYATRLKINNRIL